MKSEFEKLKSRVAHLERNFHKRGEAVLQRARIIAVGHMLTKFERGLRPIMLNDSDQHKLMDLLKHKSIRPATGRHWVFLTMAERVKLCHLLERDFRAPGRRKKARYPKNRKSRTR